MREKIGTSLHEDGVDDYFIAVAAGSVSEDTVRNFDNWFVFPASIKSFVWEKGRKKKASLAHVWGKLRFPAPCQRMKKKRGGKDLLAKDPFEGPAGDPPAFRGTLILRDGEELARRFWEFGFLDRHGLHGWTCIENQEENGGRLGVKTVRASNVKMRANEAGQASNG